MLAVDAGGSKGGPATEAAEPASQPAAASTGQPSTEAPPNQEVEYDAYEPLVMVQAAEKAMLRFDTFDAALDEFYSKVGSLPLLHPLAHAASAAAVVAAAASHPPAWMLCFAYQVKRYYLGNSNPELVLYCHAYSEVYCGGRSIQQRQA